MTRSAPAHSAAPQAPQPAARLIVGDEQLLIERAIAAAVRAVREADPAATQSRVRASELTPAWLSELVSPSLFSDSTILVVDDAQEAPAEIAEALTAHAREPAPGLVVLVVHSGGGRSKAAKALPTELRRAGAATVECPRITKPAERDAFVRQEVSAAGGTIDPAAVAALIDAVGTDLAELAAAAGQLVADAGGAVDAPAVRRYHSGRAEVTGFSVAEKALAGDRPGALAALRWALHLGVAHVLIADALADAVRTAARVGAAGRASPNALAGALGMPPWKVRKAQGQARGWTAGGLASALGIVAALNAEVKGAAVDADYALERAILQIVDLRAGQ